MITAMEARNETEKYINEPYDFDGDKIKLFYEKYKIDLDLLDSEIKNAAKNQKYELNIHVNWESSRVGELDYIPYGIGKLELFIFNLLRSPDMQTFVNYLNRLGYKAPFHGKYSDIWSGHQIIGCLFVIYWEKNSESKEK